MNALSVLLKQRSQSGQLIGQPMVADHPALVKSEADAMQSTMAPGAADAEMKSRIMSLMQRAAAERSLELGSAGVMGPGMMPARLHNDDEPLMLKVQRSSSPEPSFGPHGEWNN